MPAKKGKPKKASGNTGSKQSARFIETARKLGVDESGEAFDAVIKKIVPPRKPASRR